ncbi:hypothetical protein FRC03_004832 [Tulasnella sp. 419]|nr:hypothetical protein FRC03_004832 [Tulasnella sp. 419]
MSSSFNSLPSLPLSRATTISNISSINNSPRGGQSPSMSSLVKSYAGLQSPKSKSDIDRRSEVYSMLEGASQAGRLSFNDGLKPGDDAKLHSNGFAPSIFKE